MSLHHEQKNASLVETKPRCVKAVLAASVSFNLSPVCVFDIARLNKPCMLVKSSEKGAPAQRAYGNKSLTGV